MREIFFEILPEYEEITRTDELVRQILIQSGFPFNDNFCLAAHELIINSVEAVRRKQKNSFKEESNITVTLRADSSYAELTVTDTAGGLPQEVFGRLKDNTFDDILMEENGRGLMLVRHLTDIFEYSINNEGKAVYRIYKEGERKMDNEQKKQNEISVLLKRQEDKQVISISGMLVYQTVMEAKKGLQKLEDVEGGYVLDLSGLTQIDSTGFGLIVNIAKRLKNGAKMSLFVKDSHIRDLFSITKIDRLFPIAGTMEEALKALEKGSFSQVYSLQEY